MDAVCPCGYCSYPLEFVRLEGGQIKPSQETPSFKYPMRVRIRIANQNILCVLESNDKIRFDDGKVKTSWKTATEYAYNKVGRTGPDGRRNDPDKWLPSGWDPKRLWSINVYGFGSVTLDKIDMLNTFSGSGNKRIVLDNVPCVDLGSCNYELATNGLCQYNKTLAMFEKNTRSEIKKVRPTLVAPIIVPKTVPKGPSESETEHAAVTEKPKPSKRKKKEHAQTDSDVKMDNSEDEEVDDFSWTICAPIEEWNSLLLCKYLERNDVNVPILKSVDRTFRRFGVRNEFMEVTVIHPMTCEEFNATLPCTVLYHTPVYHKRIKEALAEFRSTN